MTPATTKKALLNIHKIIHIGQQNNNQQKVTSQASGQDIVIKPEIMVKEEEIKQEAEDYVEGDNFTPMAASDIKEEPTANNDLNDNCDYDDDNGGSFSNVAATLLVKTEIKQELEDSD